MYQDRLAMPSLCASGLAGNALPLCLSLSQSHRDCLALALLASEGDSKETRSNKTQLLKIPVIASKHQQRNPHDGSYMTTQTC